MRITYYISFAVCAAFLGTVLRAAKSSSSQLLGIAALSLLVLKLFADHTTLISSVRSLLDAGGFAEYGSTLLKALGIACVCQTGGDVCRDMGEGSVAFALELAGKIEIASLALPIAADLLAVARELIT